MQYRLISLALPLSCLAVLGCDPAEDDVRALDDEVAIDASTSLADPDHHEVDERPATPTPELTQATPTTENFIPLPICPTAPTPTSERAWKINQKGYLDTNVAFADFFNGPHTVMGWVMPEFIYNATGPIFGESGGGMYIVGQGDYRDGNGGFLTSGDPVLYVNIGGTSVRYLAPGYNKREWNHIALVRTAADANGNYTFQLYVNGQHLTPMQIVEVNGVKTVQSAAELTFGPTMPVNLPPQGALRLGRRTSGLASESSKTWQFYGLVDEVAVFDQALTSTQVTYYKNCGFTGSEAAMVAGLTFDSYSAQDPAGPKIEEPITPVLPTSNFVRRVGVATGPKWNNAADEGLFDSTFYIAPAQVTYQLPFPIGEEWRVSQGLDDPSSSHNGYAAFCWDLVRVSSPAGATVTAAAAGEIIHVEDSDVPAAGELEANKIRVKSAEDEIVGYLHQEAGTFEEVFMGGEELLFPPQNGPQFWLDVAKGEAMAKVGSNAKHLHFGASDGVLTMPIAFSAYEVKDTSVNPPVWQPVLRGQPKKGQIIRRMQ